MDHAWLSNSSFLGYVVNYLLTVAHEFAREETHNRTDSGALEAAGFFFLSVSTFFEKGITLGAWGKFTLTIKVMGFWHYLRSLLNVRKLVVKLENQLLGVKRAV